MSRSIIQLTGQPLILRSTPILVQTVLVHRGLLADVRVSPVNRPPPGTKQGSLQPHKGCVRASGPPSPPSATRETHLLCSSTAMCRGRVEVAHVAQRENLREMGLVRGPLRGGKLCPAPGGAGEAAAAAARLGQTCRPWEETDCARVKANRARVKSLSCTVGMLWKPVWLSGRQLMYCKSRSIKT